MNGDEYQNIDVGKDVKAVNNANGTNKKQSGNLHTIALVLFAPLSVIIENQVRPDSLTLTNEVSGLCLNVNKLKLMFY